MQISTDTNGEDRFAETVTERHHGDISFTSEIELSTTFIVVLPVINVHA